MFGGDFINDTDVTLVGYSSAEVKKWETGTSLEESWRRCISTPPWSVRSGWPSCSYSGCWCWASLQRTCGTMSSQTLSATPTSLAAATSATTRPSPSPSSGTGCYKSFLCPRPPWCTWVTPSISCEPWRRSVTARRWLSVGSWRPWTRSWWRWGRG